jgi:hypothetical protein
VGFLWRWSDTTHCETMLPGDSWIIPGFIPHGFYSCEPNRLGRILAVTFGCHLTGDAREELAILGADQLEQIVRIGDYFEK